MNNPEIITSFFDDDETPQEYSIFGSACNEKQRIIFNDKNERTAGFLKLPAPMFTMKRSNSLDATTSLGGFDLTYDPQRDENSGINDKLSSSSPSFSTTATFAPRLPLSGDEGNGVMHREGREEDQGTCGDITAEVHQRLQQQLALKQREVQDIQQKIAKNKKWGDPRRGPSQERHNNRQLSNSSKMPIVRSCPDSLDQMPLFDVNERMKHNRVAETGSNLNPNSPCFYPSLLTANSSAWRFGEVRSDGGQNFDERVQTGNGLNPLGLPDVWGRDMSIPSASDDGTDLTHLVEDRDTSIENGTANNKFGVVGHRRQAGRKCGIMGKEAPWHRPSMSESENNLKIPTSSVDFLSHRFGLSTSASTKNNDAFVRSRNLKNQNSFCRDYDVFGGNVSMPPRIANFETAKDEIASDVTAPNVYNPIRPRIVRKRQDTNKTWRQKEPLNHSTMQCSSCKRDYLWPHLLSCLHSFCFSCIVKHFDQELNLIKCPTCSTDTQLNKNGPQDLDLDFTTCKILMKTNRGHPYSCMTCFHDKHASVYCRDCMKFICTGCQHNHEINAGISHHKMEDVKKVKEYQGRFVETCTEHPDIVLDQYCEDCKQLVCSRCASFGERHSTHKIGDINKLHNMAAHKIRLMSSSMDEVRNEVQKRIQPLTILKQNIETSIRLCKQEIHKYSNSLLSETEKCRSNARLVIDKAHEDFSKDIDVTQTLMSQYTSEYSPLNDFCHRYLFSADPQDFMLLAPLIQNKIDKMNEKSSEIQKHKGIFEANVSLKADFAGINEYLQNQYNSILITENLSDALPSDSTEMGRRIEKDVQAALDRASRHTSPRGSGDLDPKTSPGSSGSEDADPQSEEFNYNRQGINFIHQFGNYGRGEYEFVEPSGILYLQDGSLAVCDTANHRIMVYDSQFKYLRTIGQPPNLPALRDRKEAESSRNDKYFSRTQSCLYFPYRIAQCPQTENIVVVERPPSRDIQIFTVLGEFITCFGSDILQHPRGVAVDEHGVIVTVEGRTMKLMLFSQEGHLLHRFFLSVHLEFPNDVAARDGLIYISDNRGHCVHVFDYNAEHKHTIGNESVTYYPIGVSLTHLNQVVVTDNHNTFNISVFGERQSDGRRMYEFGFKSKVRHANCYNVAVHPHRLELAVTSRENQVVVFNFDPLRQDEDDKEKLLDYVEIRFR